MHERKGNGAFAIVAGALCLVAILDMSAHAAVSAPGAEGAFSCSAPGLANIGSFEPDGAVRSDSATPSARLEPLQRFLERDARSLEPRSGSGFRVECFGANPARAHAVTWHFELEQLQRVHLSSGETVLRAYENRYRVDAPADQRRVAGTRVAEEMTLPAVEHWRVADDQSALEARSSLRRAGASCATSTGQCSRQLDVNWRLDAHGQGFRLLRTVRANGQSASRTVWNLSP